MSGNTFGDAVLYPLNLFGWIARSAPAIDRHRGSISASEAEVNWKDRKRRVQTRYARPDQLKLVGTEPYLSGAQIDDI